MITVIGLQDIRAIAAKNSSMNRTADAHTDPVAITRQYVHDTATAKDRPDLAAESDAVVGIVEKLADDPTLIGAAALGPLVREQLLSTEQIAKRLGSVQGRFCAELTRLSKLAVNRDWSEAGAVTPEQAETLRRMLLAVVNDVRLVLVRLAQVLHRMREAKQDTEEAQRRLALEVQGLYAPLANRLGVWQLKWELEDLSFRYLQPDVYRDLAQQLRSRRTEREKYLETVTAVLSAELQSAGISAEISARPKHIYSIWKKMQRKVVSLEELFDIRAVRILVANVQDCYAALGVVHNLWSYLPQEFDDYIANPKGNMYRSLHTAVFGPGREPLEVQIRTYEMHDHAELGVAAHWRYKEGGKAAPAFEQKIRWLRQLLEPGSGDSTSSNEFLAQVREDILEDRVYAISPKGDIIDLPVNATPLDFAYQVHTDVGHRCRGAKANGRIVNLTYNIQNGDQIEIITARDAGPSRDWLVPRLGFLASNRSRTKVRAWFRQQDRDQNRKQGREIFEREMQRLNLKNLPATKIAGHMKFADVEALHVALGSGDVTPAAIASAVQHLQSPQIPHQRKRRRSAGTAEKPAGIRVRGVGDLLSQFARCCRPIPPDRIGGYITQGRGVTIHRFDCGNFQRLRDLSRDRIIEVDWGHDNAKRYSTDLRIEALDRPGLLRDISAVLADEEISVFNSTLNVDKKRQLALFNLTVEVSDLETLSRALGRIDTLASVQSVRRRS